MIPQFDSVEHMRAAGYRPAWYRGAIEEYLGFAVHSADVTSGNWYGYDYCIIVSLVAWESSKPPSDEVLERVRDLRGPTASRALIRATTRFHKDRNIDWLGCSVYEPGTLNAGVVALERVRIGGTVLPVPVYGRPAERALPDERGHRMPAPSELATQRGSD